MSLSQILLYAAIAVTSIALVAFVFLILPGRKPAAAAPSTSESILTSPVQQSTLSASLIGAAPRGYTGWIERQIVLAGRPIGWTLARILTWKVVLAVVGLVLGSSFVFIGGPQPMKILLAGAAIILLFFLPDVLINSRAHDRQRAITLALPDTLDQMTIAVEAGLGFDAAMAKSARGGSGPLSEELIRVLQDMSIGRTRRDAYLELERRTDAPDLRRFIRAIIQADSYGVAIGDVLRVQAGEMRLKRRQRAEEQAMKVTVKIIFPLVFCLLPVLFIVIMTPAVLGIFDAFNQ